MKRLASMFLALCLILGMAPPRTLAADAPPELAAALAEAVPDDATLLSVYGVPASETIEQGGADGANTIAGEFRTDDANGQAADTSGNGDTSASDTPSGTCGDNLTWTLVNGVLTISGTGKMADYDYKEATEIVSSPWFSWQSSIQTVVIENGVSNVGSFAFAQCTELTAATIADSVTEIETDAFWGCEKLSTVNIPDSVTSIGYAAFNFCDLTSVSIPASVHTIESHAFTVCSRLTGIAVASDNPAFSSENGVLFNKDKTQLLCYPIGKSETAYTIPSTVAQIGVGAFVSCSLTSVTIPASVTEIDTEAFEDCAALTDVYYGGTKAQWSAVTIGEYNAALASATIHCTDGDIIGTQSGDSDTYTVTFDTHGGTPEYQPVSVQANATVSEPTQNPTRDGYEFMGWFTDLQMTNAFDFKTPITQSLTLHAGWKQLPAVEDCAVTFDGNGGTPQREQYVVEMNTTFSDSVQTPARDGYEFMGWFTDPAASGKAFNFDTPITGNLTLYAGWKAVSQSPDILASGYCGGEGDGTNLSYVLTQDGTLTISGSGTMKDYAYYDDAPWYDNRGSITKAVVESGVTSIDDWAFNECHSLTSVEIPNSVTSIGNEAFCRCTGLTEITVAPENSAYKSEDGILFDRNKTQLIRYPVGKSETAYTVPDGITSLAEDSFCSSRLTRITIPASVASIGRYTFWHCYDLTDIYFGGTETQWNAIPGVFRGDIASKVTIHCTDGDILPEGSDILDRGQCGSNLTWTLTKDGTLTISGSGEMSEYSATSPAPWYGNRQSVKKLVVGSGVSKIGAYAFNGCTALETVSFAGTPEQWDSATKAIVEAYDDDPLEFAEVTCGGERYNLFRALNPLAKMNGFLDTKWEFPAPLNRFRNLYIDVADVDLANATPLEKKATAAELPHEEGMKAYAAESGSTVLTIPDETFHTFEEGSHRITATFETKANPRDDTDTGFRSTSNVYTIFPDGPIVIDDREMVKNAVQDVSYTARLQTTPKLSDKFYKFEIVSAQLGDAPLTVTTISDYKETENEEATTVQKLGDQNFYFHPNGRFTGVPSLIGDYKLTVNLYVRRELNEDWKLEIPAPDDTSHTNPVTVEIHVEAKTAVNVKTDSPGYVVVQEPPMTLEEGSQFSLRVQIDDPEDKLVAVYLDDKKLKDTDYQVSTSVWNGSHWVQLEDAGGATQNYIQVKNTNIAQGFHSLNFEWTHKDVRGNTQTKNVARGVNVVPRTSRSSGGGGGGTTTTPPSTYAVKAARTANGTIALGVTRAKAGATVTFTVTPKSGYEIKGVSATDSKKRSVTLKRDGNKYSFTMPKLVVTVSASFSLSTYGVTASQAQHGKVSLNHANAAPGTIINGTTTPDKGYLLSGVTVRDAAGKSVKSETFDNGKFTFLMPSGKVTVNATFTVKRLASFVDIQGPDWFFDDAEWAYQKGILRGVTEQYWEPQSRISAVTSVVTLERLDGVDLSEYDTGAEDGLDNGAWYVAAARWANVNGILPDGLSVDRDALSRGDFAVMLANFLRYRGIGDAPGDATFTDADAMSPAELDAFRILQKADVFRGYKDGTINPRGYLSRAHLSALLRRLSDYVIKAEQERFTGA